ncbi:7064_t:CDS:2 [Diversispora eburnea]|uniref:7064_t:CDS:1 n=1 Tax=Diversispora eburnea TaxID=1213867 RepID=A0A9N8V0G6_9GLOM|nr:7064_t:CDS:2 [Diversispora eburnea]
MARRKLSGAKRSTSEFDIESLPEYQFDSMTKPGYEILLAQAEIRKYLRKIKYELPQLEKFANPFNPPKKDQILCFKRMYYIGEEHPLQNKVVMTVELDDLPLTEDQKRKFILLCGTRFDGSKTFKFSSEKFPHLTQNKRYLSDLMDRLLKEAQDETDTFKDIPIDTRHIKKKKKIKFPIEWRLSPQEITTEKVDTVDTVVGQISSSNESNFEQQKLDAKFEIDIVKN